MSIRENNRIFNFHFSPRSVTSQFNHNGRERNTSVIRLQIDQVNNIGTVSNFGTYTSDASQKPLIDNKFGSFKNNEIDTLNLNASVLENWQNIVSTEAALVLEVDSNDIINDRSFTQGVVKKTVTSDTEKGTTTWMYDINGDNKHDFGIKFVGNPRAISQSSSYSNWTSR